MSKRYYFASKNAYGSETSHGFLNTNYAIAFTSKQARDAYCDASRDLSVYPITAREAKRLVATEWDGRRTYVTATGEQIRIEH